LDNRCFRKLTKPPQEFCPAAIQHLRWRESLGREPTEQEEVSAPGCIWSVRSHEDMFCFFKSISCEKEPLTDSQIAHMLGVSEITVKKTRERAILKIANLPEFREIKELYKGEVIIQERQVDPYEDCLMDISGISPSSIETEVLPILDDVN